MSIGRRRLHLPRSLVAVALPPTVTTRIQQIVGGEAQLQSVDSLHAASDAIRATLESCVLVIVPGDVQLDHLPAHKRFRELYPHVPVVALFVEGLSTHRGTMLLARTGVSDIVSVDEQVDADALRVALARAHALGVSHRVWEECKPRLPDTLVTLLKTALRLAHQPITGQTLAAAAGMPERSLRRHCQDAALPSPQWIIGWARLLIAGFYLDEPGRTVMQVAELLQFPSSCALRNQLRRYTGLSARRIRSGGSTALLCRALEHAIEQHELQVKATQVAAPLRLLR